MENLGQIVSIRDKIKTASRPAIQALYKLIFEKEGDRTSRHKLREFSGFTFQDESDEYRTKFEYSNIFNIGDLTSICNLLGLNYTGAREELRSRVIHALMDINSLVPQDNQDEDGEDDDDADNEDTDDNVSQHSSNNQSGPVSDNSCLEDDRHKRRKKKVKFALHFKDVEDTVRTMEATAIQLNAGSLTLRTQPYYLNGIACRN
ncbi:PREDICTED: protein DEK-like [Trachymyrmex cornetzi]|uniref:protein DEK-like n=1 Tax=Trachymyrmex cornetzi TaxID=471704 RepID=UPI00084F51DE|nr:PREDICTED: protein DEK-like [Trachymyrmex cornetzi]